MSDNSLIQTTGLGAFLDQSSREYSGKRKLSGVFWTGNFLEYVDLVQKRPSYAHSAFQRMHTMVMRDGHEDRNSRFHKNVIVPHYKFFDDPHNRGMDAVFGIDEVLAMLVGCFKSAALYYGTEKRVILPVGPTGSAKSTIARLLKRGLERYSLTPEGALCTYAFKSEDFYGAQWAAKVSEGEWTTCPMRDDPLKLIPKEDGVRLRFLEQLGLGNAEHLMTDLCPVCQFVYRKLLDENEGDFMKVLTDKVQIQRTVISENNREGISTFQPKDEKNQDSTELTGDVDYRKIAAFGRKSDPRAFDFSGEFEVSNRGMIELIEVLKLEVAFLYDLLGLAAEHNIKPRGFPQVAIDTVAIGHTNMPEFNKLKGNEFMEALKSRTIRIDVPYNVVLNDEMRIYQRDFVDKKHVGKHFAPYTDMIPSMFAILTRLGEPKHHGLSLMQKLKLYNGKELPGFTKDNVAELRREAKDEGMSGIGPRFVQDMISEAMIAMNADGSEIPCINPFMVLDKMKVGLAGYSLITDETQRERFRNLIGVVRDEFTDMVKLDVQNAIAADPEALDRVCGNYIDNVKAYTQREKVKNKFTGENEQPDERLMRSIEDKIDIPETRKDDFRREIMNFIGALSLDGKKFDYKSNERLQRALESKLFEDQKDTIKLTSLVSQVIDKDTQEKIDIVKARLKKHKGCCDHCATDYLQYVASIFARGEVKGD